MKKVIFGGLFGGIVLFAWSCLSWMVLPFHGQTINNFKDTAAVQATIMLNVDKAGVYTIPACPMKSTASPEAKEVLKKEAMAQRTQGPVAFAIVNPNGVGAMPVNMIKALLASIIGVMLVTWLLFQTSIESFFGRVLFFTVFGLAASVVAIYPVSNWWGLPLFNTLIDTADLVIGFFLAGLLISFCASRCEATSGKKRK